MVGFRGRTQHVDGRVKCTLVVRSCEGLVDVRVREMKGSSGRYSDGDTS